MKKPPVRLTLAAALLLGLGLVSCDDGRVTGSDDSIPQGIETGISFSASVASETVGMSILATGPGILPDTIVQNIPVTAGVASGTVKLPSGSDREVIARAFDGGGIMTHEGRTTVDIHPSGNPDLTITLYPLIGDQTIEVTVSGLVLELSHDVVHVTQHLAEQVTATITDGSGEDVSGIPVIWGSSNPVVASVSPEGLVTGHTVGATTITVAAANVVRALALTVLDPGETFARGIAFEDGGDIYTMPLTGGEPRLLIENAGYPAFAPDGSRLAYIRGNTIYSSTVDGAHEQSVGAVPFQASDDALSCPVGPHGVRSMEWHPEEPILLIVTASTGSYGGVCFSGLLAAFEVDAITGAVLSETLPAYPGAVYWGPEGSRELLYRTSECLFTTALEECVYEGVLGDPRAIAGGRDGMAVVAVDLYNGELSLMIVDTEFDQDVLLSSAVHFQPMTFEGTPTGTWVGQDSLIVSGVSATDGMSLRLMGFDVPNATTVLDQGLLDHGTHPTFGPVLTAAAAASAPAAH